MAGAPAPRPGSVRQKLTVREVLVTVAVLVPILLAIGWIAWGLSLWACAIALGTGCV